MNDMHLHSAVSDLMNGISQENISGIAGHKEEYWKQDTQNITSEAFVHLFECQFDKERYDEMKKYFPNALKYFEKLIKSKKG